MGAAGARAADGRRRSGGRGNRSVSVRGRRLGSLKRSRPCSVPTRKPGVKGRSLSAHSVSRRRICGNDVLKTWKPRSTTNPSRRSERIRPPT